MRARTLACRLGRHDWSLRIEEGSTYIACAACGIPDTADGRTMTRSSPTLRLVPWMADDMNAAEGAYGAPPERHDGLG
jgi:hypothetical protein